jgi:hypothetical protein
MRLPGAVYGVGTSRFSSSIQFWTITICGAGPVGLLHHQEALAIGGHIVGPRKTARRW